MKFYMAPLEGITGHVFRRAFCECFGSVDQYFIPFIKPNQHGHLSSRERQDVLPENNQGMYAVPQILTNSVEDFVRTAQKLKQYGYQEINLNLGCPSGTVVSKKRGSGFLAFPEELDQFLDGIFGQTDAEISIKTRIGKENPEEFGRLLEIYNQYPVKELIIHQGFRRIFIKTIPIGRCLGKPAKTADIRSAIMGICSLQRRIIGQGRHFQRWTGGCLEGGF